METLNQSVSLVNSWVRGKFRKPEMLSAEFTTLERNTWKRECMQSLKGRNKPGDVFCSLLRQSLVT